MPYLEEVVVHRGAGLEEREVVNLRNKQADDAEHSDAAVLDLTLL